MANICTNENFWRQKVLSGNPNAVPLLYQTWWDLAHQKDIIVNTFTMFYIERRREDTEISIHTYTEIGAISGILLMNGVVTEDDRVEIYLVIGGKQYQYVDSVSDVKLNGITFPTNMPLKLVSIEGKNIFDTLDKIVIRKYIFGDRFGSRPLTNGNCISM